MQKDEISKDKLGETSLSAISDTTYITAATSENTRRAYQSDIEHFLSVGHEVRSSPKAAVNFNSPVPSFNSC